MRVMHGAALSLATTLAAVWSVGLAAAALLPEMRPLWRVAAPGTLFGLGGWLLFFLPLVVREARSGRPLARRTWSGLGAAAGALFPGVFLALNGAYFWEWKPGHPMSLSLLAIPAAMAAGWAYASLRGALLVEQPA